MTKYFSSAYCQNRVLILILLGIFIAYLVCPSYTIQIRFQLDRLFLVLLAPGFMIFLIFLLLTYSQMRVGHR
jgi:hypothetical protein